jgi:hypothetical protein
MEDPWSDAETKLGKDLEISERVFPSSPGLSVSWRRMLPDRRPRRAYILVEADADPAR